MSFVCQVDNILNKEEHFDTTGKKCSSSKEKARCTYLYKSVSWLTWHFILPYLHNYLIIMLIYDIKSIVMAVDIR